ncbi:MAG: EamA/RhaT family transporter [Sphingobacteriaceae bacterium]|nr:EamA/RhaT family transporter [Sphingobacteriaceae bacterium]
MKTRLLVHGSLLLTALFYGASYTVAKEVMPRLIQPYAFILLRVVIATAFFWLAHPLFESKRAKVNSRDLAYLAMCAFFGVAGNMLLFFKGLSLSSPINASVIMITSPIFILAFASFYLKEKLGWKKLTGMALGSAGALLLILSAEKIFARGGAANSTWGNLLVMLNAMLFSVYLVLIKPMMARYSTFTVVKWLFLFGSVMVLPFGLPQLSAIPWSSFASTDWAAFWFIIVGISIAAYWLNAWALQHTRASVVGTYIYLQPLLATIIALWAGRDRLLPEQVLYGLLIFAGVYLVSEAKK